MYDAQQSIFDELWGTVSSTDETLYRMLGIKKNVKMSSFSSDYQTLIRL